MALNPINFYGSIVEHQLAFFRKLTQLAVYREAAADPNSKLAMIGPQYAVLRADIVGTAKREGQYLEIWGTKSNMHVLSTAIPDADDLRTVPERTNSIDVDFTGDDGCIFWAYGKSEDTADLHEDYSYLIVGTGDFRNLPGQKPSELVYIPIPLSQSNSIVISCTGNYKIHISY